MSSAKIGDFLIKLIGLTHSSIYGRTRIARSSLHLALGRIICVSPDLQTSFRRKITVDMEEILELKNLLLKGDLTGSLAIVEELEEMGRKDIIKTIRSYAVILLLHLIKQEAENRTTRSWDVSIRNSILEIQEENQRPKSAGYYLNQEELQEILEKAYRQALNKACLEVKEGFYDVKELAKLVNQQEILEKAMNLITNEEE